jgi:hypothetical protein
MVTVSQAAMLMSGNPGDAAFLDVRSIGGLTDDVNRALSQKVCKLLSDSLGIPEIRLPELHRCRGEQLGLEREHVRVMDLPEAKGTYVPIAPWRK